MTNTDPHGYTDETKLEAAAPDLLAELQEIVIGWTQIERREVRGRRLTDWEEERLKFAREVIAKATGPAVRS